MTISKLTVVMLIAIFSFSVAAKPSLRLPAKSTTYELGKPTQNIKPRYVRESIRSDGSKSIIYGQTIDKHRKIIDKLHGHSVVDKNGKLVYSRTQQGTVLLDDQKSKNSH